MRSAATRPRSSTAYRALRMPSCKRRAVCSSRASKPPSSRNISVPWALMWPAKNSHCRKRSHGRALGTARGRYIPVPRAARAGSPEAASMTAAAFFSTGRKVGLSSSRREILRTMTGPSASGLNRAARSTSKVSLTMRSMSARWASRSDQAGRASSPSRQRRRQLRPSGQ